MTTKSKTRQTAAPASTDAFESVVSAGKESVEQAMKASADAYAKGYEKAIALNKESLDSFVKTYDDFATLGKENVSAFVSAGNIVAKGVEAINGEVVASTRSYVEEGIATTKAVLGAKTLKEAIELQSTFAQTQLQAFLATGSKLGEMSVKLGSEASAPFNTQMAAAVQKFVKPLSF